MLTRAEDQAARSAAKERGEKKYQGSPCVRCGSVERRCSNRKCAACDDQRAKDWYAVNKGRKAASDKEWRAANKDRISATGRRWYADNRDYFPQWRRDNAPKVRGYERARLARDPKYRMMKLLRSRINRALRSQGAEKSCATIDLIGCSADFLKRHLEERFEPGMSWENRGEWHVDHIRPLASFDLTQPEEQRAANHYSNLQPLWAADNMAKSDSWLGVAA